MRRLLMLGVGVSAILGWLGAAPATAQPAKAPHETGMPGMSMAGAPMNGQHEMAAVVTAVDKKTGLLDVVSDGFNLRLHFPPAALANVQKGQRITLHMGFSKP
jgi:hypothetical protein